VPLVRAVAVRSRGDRRQWPAALVDDLAQDLPDGLDAARGLVWISVVVGAVVLAQQAPSLSVALSAEVAVLSRELPQQP
jgi:hypothetical protein